MTTVYVSATPGAVITLMIAGMDQMNTTVNMKRVDLMSSRVEMDNVLQWSINVTMSRSVMTAPMNRDVVQLLHLNHAGIVSVEFSRTSKAIFHFPA